MASASEAVTSAATRPATAEERCVVSSQQCWVRDCKVCAIAQEYSFSDQDILQIALICLGLNRYQIRRITGEYAELSRERTADIRNKLGARSARNIRIWARKRGLATK